MAMHGDTYTINFSHPTILFRALIQDWHNKRAAHASS
ncbi:BnaC02g43820D [Brassica napus]|uniref:(rape) hypothetical protein n=1 Tax=Brassica napus TaxID=3708 RepID=A0A078H5X3_BRANA|nr:unnamed protein product [Brassica napus]CDY33955.1 BnaC02g43820D [Brassica napus]